MASNDILLDAKSNSNILPFEESLYLELRKQSKISSILIVPLSASFLCLLLSRKRINKVRKSMIDHQFMAVNEHK